MNPALVLQILAIVNTGAELILSGKLNPQKFRDFYKANGATHEQLAALDVRQTAAIDRRNEQLGDTN